MLERVTLLLNIWFYQVCFLYSRKTLTNQIIGMGQAVQTYAGIKCILRVFLFFFKETQFLFVSEMFKNTRSRKAEDWKQHTVSGEQQSATQEDFPLTISSISTFMLLDALPALLRHLKMLPGLHFNSDISSALITDWLSLLRLTWRLPYRRQKGHNHSFSHPVDLVWVSLAGLYLGGAAVEEPGWMLEGWNSGDSSSSCRRQRG